MRKKSSSQSEKWGQIATPAKSKKKEEKDTAHETKRRSKLCSNEEINDKRIYIYESDELMAHMFSVSYGSPVFCLLQLMHMPIAT